MSLEVEYAHGSTTASDGVRLAWKRAGRGPTGLVFMHGWGSTANYFDQVIAHLDLERLQVVSFDLRGHGDSQRTACGLDVPRLARDMLEVVRETGLERFVSAGHSMGAKFIQYLPLLDPAPVLGQVLIAGTPACSIPVDPAVITTWADMAGNADALRESHHQIITRPVAHGVSEQWVREASAIEREVLFETLRLCFDADFAADLTAAPIPPTLAIAGSDDPFFAPSMLRERMVDTLPGSRMVVLECGHEIPLELPLELARLTEAFVAGCAGGRGL